MSINKEYKRTALLYLVLTIAAGIIQAIFIEVNIFSYQCVVACLYIYIYIHWRYSIRRRFIQKDMQRLLIIIADLMILWAIAKTVKYSFSLSRTTFNDMLWYSYYIPYTLIPLLMFIATLYINKHDHSNISNKWKLVFIPAFITLAGIMTNDFHQLAFHFSYDGTERSYSYGPFYYASLVILILSLTGTLVNVFYTCARHHFLKNIWLTILVIIFGLIYLLLYIFPLPGTTVSPLNKFCKMPDFTCLFFISFFESLVYTHMIPSNSEHALFLQYSSINAGLTDMDCNIVAGSLSGIRPEPEQIRQALDAPCVLSGISQGFPSDEDNAGNNYLLKTVHITGGYFYWLEDITELMNLNRELADTGSYLEEENLMLDASVKLRESRKRTEERNRLYDKISRSLKPQLNMISDIIANLPEDEAGFRQSMKHAAILGAYFKRRSNLLLLADSAEELSSEDLYLSINESMSYIAMQNILCNVDIKPGLTLNSGLVLFLYALFEDAVERALPDVRAIMVTLRNDGSAVIFSIELEAPRSLTPSDWNYIKATELNGYITSELSETTGYITFTTAGEV